MYGQTIRMYKTLVDAYRVVLLRMGEKNLVLPLAMIMAMCGGGAVAQRAQAETLTWDTSIAADGTITDGSGSWTDGAGNWNDGVTSVGVNWDGATPDQAIFSGASGGTITLAAGGVTANALTFNGTADYKLSGGALTLGGAAPAITVASGRNAIIKSVVAGSAGLSKAGAGTLTLTGVNTFSGGTSIDAGTLSFGNGSLGTGLVTMNGGTLQWYYNNGFSGDPYTVNTQDVSSQIVMVAGKTATFDINGSGSQITFASGIGNGTNASLAVTGGSGFLILKGVNTYTGDTTVGATLQIQGAGSLGAGAYAGNITIASGKNLFYSSSANQLLSGSIGGAGTLRTFQGTGNLTVSGAIGGGLVVEQNAAGTTLTLAGANTYTGVTVVNAGTLQVGDGGFSGALGSGGVSVNTNGILAFNRGDALAVSNTVSGSGTVMQKGAGTTTLSGASTYTGPTVVNGGTLRAGIASAAGINGAFGLNSLISMANTAGATLDLAGYNTQTGALSGGGTAGGDIMLGSATLTLGADNGTQTYAGIISGSGNLVKKGAGTQTLSGDNTYTGTTTVSAGTLNITGTLDSAISVASGAVLSGQGGSTSSDLALGAGSSIMGVAGSAGAGNAFRAAGTVTAGASVAIFGADNNPALGSHILDVVGYGTTPGTANFSTANYRSAVLADDTANKKITLTYTNALDVWNSGSATWNTMGVAAWRNGLDQKFSSGDNVVFDDTGSAAGTAITVTLTSAQLPGDVVFNNSTTSYTLRGSGQIAGATALTKNGTGSVTLVSANAYTGGTTINAGTLVVNNTQSLGTGAVVNNGTLAFSGLNSAAPVSNIISGTGSVAQQFGGITTLTGPNTYSGGTVLTAGTLSFANGALGSGIITLNGGTLRWNGSNTEDVSSRLRLVNSGTPDTVDTNGNNVTFASAIGSPLTSLVLTHINTVTIPEVTGYWTTNLVLTKAGAGTLTLGGAGDNPNLNLTANAGSVVLAKTSGAGVHAVTGSLTIGTSGMVQLAGTGGDQIGDASLVNMSSGAVLDFNGRDEAFGYLPDSSGAGAVIRNSAAGTTSTMTLSGYATMNYGFGGVIQDGAGVMALTKVGTSGQMLVGASTYTGATTVLGGTLTAGVATVGGAATPISGAFGVNSAMTVASGATLALGGFNQTLGSLAGGGTVSGSAVLTVGGTNASTEFSGAFQGNGGSLIPISLSLSKIGTGTLVLSGFDNYSGTTTIAGGTLQIGNGGAAGTLGTTGNVVNNAALVFNRGDAAYAVSNVISGTGSVRQAGPGTITLTRANTYAGATTVDNGILKLDFSAAGAPAANILSGSSPLVLSGGRLQIKGRSGQNGIIQSFGGMTSAGAGGVLELIQNGATTADVSLGALTLGAPVNFVGGTGTAAGARFITTSSAGADDGTTQLANGSLWNGAVWASIKNSGGVNYVVQWDGTYTDVYTGTGGGPVGIPDAPTPADVRIVEGGSTGSPNTLAASTTTINSLLMSAGTTASVVQMAGKTLVVNGTGMAGNIALAGGAQALTLGSAANEGFLTAGASGAATLTLVDGNANANLRVNAVIQDNAGAGPVSVVISGGGVGGRVVFGGANTYTGATTVADGTLQLNDGATLGGGVVTNNGNLALNFNGATTLNDAIGGSGALQITGSGTTTILGDNTYSGVTTVAAGTLQVGNGGTSGKLGSGNVVDNAVLAFDHSGTSTVSNMIGGTGSLVQKTGTLVLTGNNTYAGGTTISAGTTLQVGDGGTSGTLGTNSGFDPYGTGSALPGVNSGTIVNNGTLVFNRSDASLVIDMPITGTGSVRQAGLGTTTLTGGHASNHQNSYSGGTVVSSGTLVLKFSGVAGPGAITLGDAATGSNAASLLIRGATYNDIVVSAQGTGVATIGAVSDSGLVSSSGLPPLPFYGAISLNRATTLSSANYYGVKFNGVISGNVGTLTLDGHGAIGSGSLGSVIILGGSSPGQANTFVGNLVLTGYGTKVTVGNGINGYAGNFIPDASNVDLGTGTDLYLTGNEAFNALTGLGSVLGAASNGWGTSGATGTTATLTVGAGNGSGVFGGSIGSDSASTDIFELETMHPGIVSQLTYAELRPLIRPTFSADSTNVNVVKTGTGTQTFAGQSMYLGSTTVLAGTLKAGVESNVLLNAINPGISVGTFFPYGAFGNGYSSAAYMSVAAGATLDLNGYNQLLGSLANYAGSGGTVTSGAPGAVTLVVGGNNQAPSATTTFGGVIQDGSGIVSLRKVGVGTQTLTGANTYTGATTVTSDVTAGNPGVGTGTLVLDFSAAGAPATNIVSSASPLVLSGGILKIKGKAGQNGIVQTFNGLSTGSQVPTSYTVQNGDTNRTVSDGNGGTVTLAVGDSYPLTRGPGGTIQLVQNGATTLDVDLGSLDLTGPVNFVGGTGIVPGARFITSSSAGANDAHTQLAGGSLWNGSTWASIADSGGVHYVVMWDSGTPSTDVYTGTGGGSVVLPNAPAADVRLLEGGSVGAPNTLAAATTTIHSLLMSAATTSATLKMDTNSAGDTLVVGDGASASGGIAMAQSAQSLTVGQSAGQGFLTAGTSGASTLGLTNANTSANLTVNAVIKDNAGGGAVGLTVAGPGTIRLLGANTYTGTTTIGSGTLQVGNGGTTGSLGGGGVVDNGVLAFNRSDTVTVSNAISGSGALEQNGANILTLTGANTYAGTTSIATGSQLRVGTGGALGSGNVVNNGILSFNSSGTVLVAGGIGGFGVIQQSGSGTTILAGNGTSGNSTGGVTTISAGTLQVGNGGTSGSLGSEDVVDNGALVFNRTDSMTVSNAISGTGRVNQIGTGTTVLTGTNTYSGTTTITRGTLQVGTGAFAGTLGSGNVVNNGTLALNVVNSAGYPSIANAISGAGSVINNGNITVTGTNTYTGTTTNNGTLRIGDSNASGTLGTGAVINNGTLDFNRTDAVTFSNAISGSGEVRQFNSGAPPAATTGVTTLTGTNTYTGITTVNNGTLVVGNGGTSGTLGSGAIYVNNQGTLVFNRSGTLTVGYVSSTSSGNGTVRQNGSGLTILTGVYTAGGSTFTSAGGFYGDTIISAGTLQVGNGGVGGGLGVGAVTNNATLAFNRSNTLTVSNAIGGSGAVRQIGAGTTVFTGQNTYAGQTQVSAGTLKLDFAAASAASNIVSASSALSLNGGILVIQGKSGAVNTQSFASTGATNNGGTLQLVQNGATSLDVNLGALTLNGAIRFVGGTGITQGARFITTSSAGANDAQTQLGGGALWNGSTWASIQDSAGVKYVVQWQGSSNNVYTGSAGGTVVVPDVASADVNILEGGAGTNTLAAATTGVNSLMVSAGTTAATVKMNAHSAGDTLVVGNGNVALAAAAKGLTIGEAASQGFLTAGVSGATALNLTNASVNSALTVNAVIKNNAGGGAVALNVSDSGGKVVLAGANTYTGATAVRGGTLQVNTNNALGATAAGTTVDSGASLKLNGVNYAAAEALTLNGAGVSGGGALRNAGTSTYAGAIRVASDAILHAGGGTLTLTGGLTNNNTTVTLTGGGTININAVGVGGTGADSDLVVDGTTVNANAANTHGGQTVILNGGVLNANAANALPTVGGRSLLTMDGSGTGSSRLALGSDQSIAGLVGAGSSVVGLNAHVLTIGAASGTTSFAGILNGSGGVVKDGASTQVFSGAITNAGTTTVSGGALAFDGGSTSLAGLATIRSGATLAVGNGVGAANSALLSFVSAANDGSLRVMNDGRMDLTGASTLSGTGVLINDGTLGLANGFATTNAVTNNARMQVAGSVTTGTLAFASGSTLVLADGNAHIDAPSVTVAAGAKVAATSSSGFVPGVQKSVIRATGAASGSFIVDTALSAAPAAGYHWVSNTMGRDVFLGIQHNGISTAGLTPQQQNVAQALNAIGGAVAVNRDIQNGAISPLSSLSGNALAEGLGRLGGNDRAGMERTTFQHAFARGQDLLGFSQIGLGADAYASAAEDAANQAMRATALRDFQFGTLSELGEDQLQCFVRATHVSESQEAQSSGVLGTSGTGNVFTIGLNHQLVDGGSMGVAFTYDATKVSSDSGLASSDSRTYGLDVYASHLLDQNWFVAGVAGFGVVQADNKRHGITPANLTATSNTDGLEMHLAGQAGYMADLWRNARLVPYGGLAYVRNTTAAAEESLPGATGLALAYDKRTSRAWETTLGADFAQGFELGEGHSLVASVGVAWHHQLSNTNNQVVGTHFAGAPGTSFNTNLGALGQDALELNAGLGMKLPGGFEASVNARSYRSLDSGAKGHQESVGVSLKYNFF